MITADVAKQRIRESLAGFPKRVTEAYLEYAEKGNLANLDVVALGVLHFYLAKKPSDSIDTLPGSTRLVEDLGCDSLTMMDMVFMLETLFDIKLADEDLPKIVTLDDLRAYLRTLLAASTSPA